MGQHAHLGHVQAKTRRAPPAERRSRVTRSTARYRSPRSGGPRHPALRIPPPRGHAAQRHRVSNRSRRRLAGATGRRGRCAWRTPRSCGDTPSARSSRPYGARGRRSRPAPGLPRPGGRARPPLDRRRSPVRRPRPRCYRTPRRGPPRWSRGSRLSSPAIRRRNQPRSTSVMCRTSPSSDSVDGGAERCLSCSAVSPLHLLSSVWR